MLSSEIYDDVLLSLDNIWTVTEKDKLFVNLFFLYNSDIQHNIKLKRILAASVLRYHHVFIGIIRNEPFGKCTDTSHHTFYQKIISILSENEVSDQTFKNGG